MRNHGGRPDSSEAYGTDHYTAGAESEFWNTGLPWPAAKTFDILGGIATKWVKEREKRKTDLREVGLKNNWWKIGKRMLRIATRRLMLLFFQLLKRRMSCKRLPRTGTSLKVGWRRFVVSSGAGWYVGSIWWWRETVWIRCSAVSLCSQ